MRTYNEVDFQINPKKYELFRTAVARQHLFTDNAEGDVIEPGTVVAIEYRRTAPNYLYERNEPVYEIKGYDTEVRGSHLEDFLL